MPGVPVLRFVGLLLFASTVDAETVDSGPPLRLLVPQGSEPLMEAVWTVPRGRNPQMPAVPPGMTALEVKAIQDMMVFFPQARVARSEPQRASCAWQNKKQWLLLLAVGHLELKESAQ